MDNQIFVCRRGLGLDQAVHLYTLARDDFEKVRDRYSGLFSQFRSKISDEDKKTLYNCTSILLPLQLEASVQEQVRSQDFVEGTLCYQIMRLQQDIMEFCAYFKNTGIKKVA